MENKLIVGIIASIIIGLTSWNLKETYEISKSIVLLKEKVSQIEKTLDKKSFSKRNRRKRKRKRRKLNKIPK